MKVNFVLTIIAIILVTVFQQSHVSGYSSADLHNVTTEQTKENTLKALSNAEIIIKGLSEDGFNVVYFNDTLIDAKNLFNKTVYNYVLQKYQEIIARKDRAYLIRDNLRALELRIQEVSNKNLSVEDASKTLEKTRIEFKNERYDRVEELIVEGNKKLNDIEAQSGTLLATLSAAKDNIFYYIKSNWHYILALIIILGIVGFFSFRKYRIIRTENKVEDLKLENEVIRKQIKKTQEKYFKTKKISKPSYDVRMEEYQKRMNQIKESLPVLEKRLKKMKARKTKI